MMWPGESRTGDLLLGRRAHSTHSPGRLRIRTGRRVPSTPESAVRVFPSSGTDEQRHMECTRLLYARATRMCRLFRLRGRKDADLALGCWDPPAGSDAQRQVKWVEWGAPPKQQIASSDPRPHH